MDAKGKRKGKAMGSKGKGNFVVQEAPTDNLLKVSEDLSDLAYS